jgi:hypothetical protein
MVVDRDWQQSAAGAVIARGKVLPTRLWNPAASYGLMDSGATQVLRADGPLWEPRMILLLTFTAIFLVGQATNVGIALVVEKFSDSASLAVFFALFAVVVVAGWQLAVWLTDRLFGPASHERRT